MLVQRVVNAASPINRNHFLTQGLEAWWLTLDCLSHGFYWRELMKGNDGTLANGTAWVTVGTDGRQNALSFDGTNDNVTFNAVSATTPTTYTIAFWAKRNTVGGGIGFDTIMSMSAPYAVSAWVYETGNVSFGDAGGSWATKNAIWTDKTAWHHLGFVVESSGTVRFYFDGKDQGTATGTTTGTWGSGRFGEFVTLLNNSNQYNGLLDDVKIYSRPLGGDEMWRLYQESLNDHPDMLNWMQQPFPPPTASPQVVIPSTLALTLATFAPTIKLGKIAIPSTAALTLTGFAPTVLAPQAAIPSTATLSLTGLAPTVLAPQSVTPSTATLSITTFTPTILTPTTVTPVATSLTLTGFAPTVLMPRMCVPPTQSLAVTTFEPTVVAPQVAIPSAAPLTLTTFAPSVVVGNIVIPSMRALTLTGFAPVVLTPRITTPGALALSFTLFAPTVNPGQSSSGLLLLRRRFARS